ncbi:MAG: hypothetical protein IPL28_25880 [Chloroflexi bacterium]|nr:hypothetical protein [Chloroflexota bacterium]
MNAKPNDISTLVGVIDSDAYGTGDYSTGWIDMGDWGALQAVVGAGTLGASATLDAKLEQASDGSGTGVKDITGKAITQLVKASNDDDQAIILLRDDELDVANGFTHARLTITVGTATSDAGAMVFGQYARYTPTALASVVEVVE